MTIKTEITKKESVWLKTAGIKSLFVTFHKSDKLKGLFSINSLCLMKCPFKAFCYAERYTNMRPTVKSTYDKNHEFLSQKLLNVPVFPVNSIIRFFSFGDINNHQYGENMGIIAENNKHSVFGVWVRELTYPFIKEHKKDNMTFIYSNKVLNSPVNPSNVPFEVNHTFNVVTKDKFEEIKTELESKGEKVFVCGAKSCATCKHCYTLDNEKTTILEVLK